MRETEIVRCHPSRGPVCAPTPSAGPRSEISVRRSPRRGLRSCSQGSSEHSLPTRGAGRHGTVIHKGHATSERTRGTTQGARTEGHGRGRESAEKRPSGPARRGAVGEDAVQALGGERRRRRPAAGEKHVGQQVAAAHEPRLDGCRERPTPVGRRASRGSRAGPTRGPRPAPASAPRRLGRPRWRRPVVPTTAAAPAAAPPTQATSSRARRGTPAEASAALGRRKPGRLPLARPARAPGREGGSGDRPGRRRTSTGARAAATRSARPKRPAKACQPTRSAAAARHSMRCVRSVKPRAAHGPDSARPWPCSSSSSATDAAAKRSRARPSPASSRPSSASNRTSGRAAKGRATAGGTGASREPDRGRRRRVAGGGSPRAASRASAELGERAALLRARRNGGVERIGETRGQVAAQLLERRQRASRRGGRSRRGSPRAPGSPPRATRTGPGPASTGRPARRPRAPRSAPGPCRRASRGHRRCA